MSYTQAHVDAMRSALAQGVRTVTTDGHSVTYNSPEEMRRQLAIMEAQVQGATATRQTHVYPTFGKGT